MPSPSAHVRDGEWSRSRYWHGYFLQSRHDRIKIRWDAPVASDKPLVCPAAITGLIARLTAPQAGFADVIAAAQERFPQDPAFVQSLRLMSRERQFHRDCLEKLAQRHSPAYPLPRVLQARKEMTASILGVRYFLASILLDDLLDLSLLHQLGSGWMDEPASVVHQQLVRDKTAHISFLCERLTMGYAEFNFIRRNLRRMRLRGLFAVHLRRVLKTDSATLKQAGCSPMRFTRLSWRCFETMLETVVPYHRDQLMAKLLSQQEKPYENAISISIG